MLVQGSSSVTLTEYIIVFGAFNLIVSQFPHFHSLRFINTIATFSTISFSIIAVGLSLYAGALHFRCFLHLACGHACMLVNVPWCPCEVQKTNNP